MSKKALSPELVSLIHHVELNESGWWNKAVNQVIRGVLWKDGGARTQAALQATYKSETGSQLSDDQFSRQLEWLVKQGSVVSVPGMGFKLSEKSRGELTQAHNIAIAEQEQCKNQFIQTCQKKCSTLNAPQVWSEFSKALVAAVHVTGANLYHLIADGNLVKDVDWLSAFLGKYDASQHEGLRGTVEDFFAPQNVACRNQVLRHMSAHFFAEASQLSPDTLSRIEVEKKKKSIKVILDTNFIFSVLQLHDNPGDDAALSLVEMAQSGNQHLEVKLYVLPSTLDEAQHVLLNQMNLVDRVRTTVAMSRAALSQPLPSIARKFFDAASRTPGLSAKSFFQPYVDDLRTILRSKGIAVLEAHQSIYNQRQDVVDDVLDEQQYEEKFVQESKRKGYETLLHDIILWHAVNDRRPVNADSPFEVEYWAVTIDHRLIAFDRNKRATNISKLPVVLHPSNLIQLVQFWVPRSEKLEESLFDSLRLPLYFQSFDSEDEQATIKVLGEISRFENVGDLPESTLKIVLANKALRAKLRHLTVDDDEAFQLVREEVLAQHKQAVSALEQARSSLTQTELVLQTERETREKSEQSLSETNRRLAAAQSDVNSASSRAAVAEEKIQAHASENELLSKILFVALMLAIPVLLGMGLALIVFLALPGLISFELSSRTLMIAALAGGFAPLAGACALASFVSRRLPKIEHWWLAKGMGLIGAKAIVAPAGFALTAILQGGIFEWFRAQTGLFQ